MYVSSTCRAYSLYPLTFLKNSVARECARLHETDMDIDADEGQESDSEDDDFVTAGLYPVSSDVLPRVLIC